MKKYIQALFATLCAVSFAAQAATLNLTESVSVAVPQDELTATFYVELTGTAHTELNAKAADILRKAAAAGRAGIPVATKSINTFPVYTSSGKTNKYTVRATVEVKSTKISQVAEIANDLAGFMAFDQVTYSVSPDTLKQVRNTQATVVAEKFMAKANTVATALGYQSAVVDNVGLDVGAATAPQPQMFRQAMAAHMASAPAPDMGLAGAAGLETVTTTLSGTVTLH